MTPYYGQGAGISIEDAYILSSLVGKCVTLSDLAAAFKAYDYSRVPRGCRVIAASCEQGKLLCFESPGAGDDLEKVAERLDWDKRMWMWDFDIEANGKEALGKLRKGRMLLDDFKPSFLHIH
jgi:salicylate hydroxylase